MDEENKNFQNFEELNNFIQTKEDGNILIEYYNMSDYAGMVVGIGIIFNHKKGKYELDIEWISFGLDLFGENLLENYLYKFNTLHELLAYLHAKYDILVTDIPKKYKTDESLFPNPIKDADQKPLFEAAWEAFQRDFKKGLFLDESLELVFSSTSINDN